MDWNLERLEVERQEAVEVQPSGNNYFKTTIHPLIEWGFLPGPMLGTRDGTVPKTDIVPTVLLGHTSK